jgi:hypothetical protein
MGTAAKRSIVRTLREIVTLEDFAARAGTIPSEKRTALGKRDDVLRARRRAADVLWSAGSAAVALSLARDAFVAEVELARSIDGSPALDAETEKLATRAAEANIPERDAEVVADHLILFDDIARAHRRIARTIAPYVSDDRRVRHQRVRRWATSFVVALASALFLALVVQAQFRTRAVASAAYDTKHEAGNVLDANIDSEWQLPNGQLGWLDMLLSPRRTVHRVRIVNGHNSIYNDRAVKEWTIELYSKGRLVASKDGSFDFTETPGWTTIDFGSVGGVERVHIVVKSFHHGGAAIGEVRVE